MRDVSTRAEQAQRAARVLPSNLMAYAVMRGWRTVQEEPGFVLLGFKPYTKAQLLIPLDPQDPGYVDAVLAVFQRLMDQERRSFDAIAFDVQDDLVSPSVSEERARIAAWVEDVDKVYLGVFNGQCREGEMDDLYDGLREIARRIREGKAHL